MYPGLHAVSHPDKVAVVMGRSGERITYRQLNDRSMQLAQLLYDKGLRAGDDIALFAENHARYFEVYWAALRSGLYLTAVNRLPGGRGGCLSRQRFRVEGAHHDQRPIVRGGRDVAVDPRLPAPAHDGRRRTWLRELRGRHRGLPGGAAREPAPRRRPALLVGDDRAAEGNRRALGGLQIDDPAAVGISSLERGLLGMDESSIYLCPAPLYHSAALQWSAGVHELGGTLVVMEKFDAADLLRLVERERVTHTQVVPTMLVRA